MNLISFNTPIGATMMNQTKFVKLLSGKLSGTLNTSNLRLLDQAVAGQEEYGKLYNQLWPYLVSRKRAQASEAELAGIWERIATAEEGKFADTYDYGRRGNLRRILPAIAKIAAVMLLAGAAWFLGAAYLNGQAAKLSEEVASGQETVSRTLRDGTRVWLNRNSVIRFNEAFGKHRREIALEGEAYFDVAHDKAVPLVVHAGGLDIEVKGTAFNVYAYGKGTSVQVALIRGSVKVTQTTGKRSSVLLRPNQQLVASRGPGDSVFVVNTLKPEALLSKIKWTADTLVFHKEKLRDLAGRLEKRFGVEIQIRSEELKEKRFSGTFTTESIQQVLEALKVSYPLTYTVRNKLVIIDAL